MLKNFTLAMIATSAMAFKTNSMFKNMHPDATPEAIKARIQSQNGATNPQELYFDSVIDHYDGHGEGGATYKMRYLVDDTYYNKDNGPIIFYAGNEGDIWTFWEASGFMTTTLAEQFGAMVVFAEHRYFGTSMPFGDDSFNTTNGNLNYLTVEQAMFDYVELVKSFKIENNMEDRAVIVGGGSYGGMLAAWLRMKYPQWFQGALAASAPIVFFDGVVSPNAYNDIATNDFRKADENCPHEIKKGFAKLFQLTYLPESYESIKDIFGLCSVPQSRADVTALIGTVNESLGTMAMVDYPYPTNFVNPLPAWPVNESCRVAAEAKEAHADDKYAALYPIAAAAKTFYNYNDWQECLDLSGSAESGLDDNGWAVLACNEMVMPFASNPETSMFPPSRWNEEAYTSYCQEAYNQSPQYSWALDYFGGHNAKKDFMKVSNIVFSNGELDPWQAGGITEEVSPNSTILYIENSAHHLDLRLPNEADPETLTAARQVEMEQVAKWVDQYQGTNFSDQLQKDSHFLQ